MLSCGMDHPERTLMSMSKRCGGANPKSRLEGLVAAGFPIISR